MEKLLAAPVAERNTSYWAAPLTAVHVMRGLPLESLASFVVGVAGISCPSTAQTAEGRIEHTVSTTNSHVRIRFFTGPLPFFAVSQTA